MSHQKLFVLPAIVLLLAACNSYRNVEKAPQQAQLDVPAALSEGARFSHEEPVAAWWAQLEDEPLKKLVQEALARNQDIQIAQASLAEARALLRNANLSRLPSAEAEVSATREKYSADVSQANSPSISETYWAGFDASWELDLFGRVHNQVRLVESQLEARAAGVRAAQVSVAAEVVASYVDLRGSQYLLQVANNSVKVQEETLALTQRLAEIGRGNQLDIARAQAQLQLTLASLPRLQAQASTSINRLGVLTRQPAHELEQQLAARQPLPSLPTALAVGDPVALLRRRPDIQYAEQALKGAVAEYNVQVADLYPRISLAGSLGYMSTEWENLGESSTETFRFAPSIRWAAFNLGRVNARIHAADARAQARLAEFERSVSRALEETDNALQNFSREEERRLRLREAALAGSQAAELARQRFQIGSGDFLNVLDAERAHLEINAQLAQSETQLLLNMVAIYKALGGGWETHAGNSQLSLSF